MWTQSLAQAEHEPVAIESLYDLILAGGPVMVPIGIASVVALAYAVERWIRLQPGTLGSRDFGRSVVSAVREGGVARGLDVCRGDRSSMARVLEAGLVRAGEPRSEREKAVEEVAFREVKDLAANLRPIYLVYLIAPLLGLLGTVWGMILAFAAIAVYKGLGKPELLAEGIYQALVTTAAGLTIAIPALAAHYVLKGRIERFARRTEDAYHELELFLGRIHGGRIEGGRVAEGLAVEGESHAHP